MMEMLRGIFPAAITPFTETGALDTDALRKNIKRWNEYGLRGYVVTGSTAEAPFLEEAERGEIIRVTREAMTEGMTLVAGIGRESTAQTIMTGIEASEAGADAALVVSPWYYKDQMTGPTLERHFLAVADTCPLPLLLDNMPAFTGTVIPVDTVIRLAEHSNIVGIKDNSGDISYLSKIIRNTPADFAFLCGNSAAMVSSFMLGAVGGVLNTANLAPEICVALYRASQAANFKVAQNLYHLLQPLSEVISGARGIGGLKYAMTLLGYQAGFPRAPLSSPGEADQQMIKRALQEANLLTV